MMSRYLLLLLFVTVDAAGGQGQGFNAAIGQAQGFNHECDGSIIIKIFLPKSTA